MTENLAMWIGDLDRAIRIPFEIKKLELENVGVFDKIELEFKRFTIIQGGSESGKTIILRSIAYASCGIDVNRNVGYILKHGKDSGKIKISIANTEPCTQTSFKRKGNDIQIEKSNECILLDDATRMLDIERTENFLKRLQELDSQIILTIDPNTLNKLDKEILADKQIIDLNTYLTGEFHVI